MSEQLAKKLRLKIEQQLVILNRPNNEYFAGFDVVENIPQNPVEVIILFVKTIDELKEETLKLIEKDVLSLGGRLLIAYPKKGNKVFESYIHRDDIFPALGVNDEGYIQTSDYKFNQMVKLDETYTIVGIKHEKRAKTPKKAASQCVGDYVQFIPKVEEVLVDEKEALDFFQSLTSGYQKNWARYIYSAKRVETQNKRISEMIELLKQGVKAKNLKSS